MVADPIVHTGHREHGFLRLQWRRAGIEKVILLAGLVNLARNQPSSTVGLIRVALVATDPPAPHEDVAVDESFHPSW